MTDPTTKTSRRTVLCITPWVPSASSHYAGHQWYLRHLNRLAERFELTVLAPDVPRNREPSYPWPVVLVAPSPDRLAGIEDIAALRLKGRGVTVPTMPADVGRPDVIELSWSQTMPLARALRRSHPDAIVSSIQHDRYSETLRWSRLSRQRFRARCRDWLARWVIRTQEVVGARSCDVLVGFKDDDVSWGTRWGARPIVVAPFLDEPSPLTPQSEQVLFVGAFDRPENVDGAVWLVDHVWPTVLAQRPSARLVLAGGGPSPAVRALVSDSVSVTGFVPDLRPFYRESSCVVTPIFAGGGLRFKVPQALVYGLPLVATPEALTGLEDLPRSSLAGVTSDPAEFAAAIVAVLADRDASFAASSSAMAWARKRYFDDSGSARLLDIYDGRPA